MTPDPTNSSSSSDNKESIDSIASSMKKLTAQAMLLTDIQASNIARTRRLAILAITGLALNILLTLFVGGLVRQAVVNSNAISEQQKELEIIQKVASIDGICPIYSLFLSLYDPEDPSAKAEPELYESYFVRLERGATSIGCSHNRRGLP